MGDIVLAGATSGTTTLTPTAVSGTTTLTLPATTDTLVGKTTTDTLTNKTLTSPTISGTPVMSASVITSGTAVASTSGTSIDFTSIPSWVKRVTFPFAGISTNSTSLIQLRIGSSAGIVVTGYVGSCWLANTVNTAYSTGFTITASNAAANNFSGICTLVLLNSASNLWAFSMSGGRDDGTGIVGGGYLALSGTLDRVRLTTVNGTDTFDAGSINILYE